MTDLSAAEAVAVLRAAVAAAGGNNAFARQHELNQARVSLAVNGHIEMPEAVANAVGLLKITTYRRLRDV